MLQDRTDSILEVQYDDAKSDIGSCGSCAEVPYVTGHTSHGEAHTLPSPPCSAYVCQLSCYMFLFVL